MRKKIGKLDREILENLVFKHLGAPDNSLALPPKRGTDFSVIKIGEVTLIVEVDPFFVVPEYGWDKSAWFAVHILASDVAVSGVPPRYLFLDLNLPMEMTDEELGILWRRVHEECLKLGVSIGGGHTGRYEGVSYPMLGGGVMIGVTTGDNFVSTELARPGDYVLLTKGPAIETAGILTSMFPFVIKENLGEGFLRRAEEIFWQQSVVEEALTLSRLGLRTGVSSMHDATEYGVWGALHDIRDASGFGIRVYEDRLFIDTRVKAILDLFSRLTKIEVDPYTSISEGTLVATVKPEVAGKARDILLEKGIPTEIIGVVIETGDVELVKRDGSIAEIAVPEEDPFWLLFSESRRLFG